MDSGQDLKTTAEAQPRRRAGQNLVVGLGCFAAGVLAALSYLLLSAEGPKPASRAMSLTSDISQMPPPPDPPAGWSATTAVVVPPPTLEPEPPALRPAPAAPPGPRTAAQAPPKADAGPSFPCKGQLRPSEQMVCDDRGLSELDRQVDRAFAAAVRRGYPWAQLRADQDEWAYRREAAAQHSRAAVESYYRERIAHLDALAADAD
jgi:hypothetical protein